MCRECGCIPTGEHHHHHVHPDHEAGMPETHRVMQGLLDGNDAEAGRLRESFDRHGILCVNLMSSPGSGKTSLLEATLKALPQGLRVAVIEGDLETENDAERIRRHGVPAVQITTGVACHLDANMVRDAARSLDFHAIDILFVENVGNLVCPADFDLGQHLDVVLLSVTEGDDKPAKYPPMFRTADHVLITKADLAPFIEEFSLTRARDALMSVGGPSQFHLVSAKTGMGVDAWTGWLTSRLAAHRARLADAKPQFPLP